MAALNKPPVTPGYHPVREGYPPQPKQKQRQKQRQKQIKKQKKRSGCKCYSGGGAAPRAHFLRCLF